MYDSYDQELEHVVYDIQLNCVHAGSLQIQITKYIIVLKPAAHVK